MQRHLGLLAMGVVAIAACRDPVSSSLQGRSVSESVATAKPLHAADTIPGQYIVVFKKSVAAPAARAREKVSAYHGRLLFTYGRVLKGFAAVLSDTAVAALRADPDVADVEPNAIVTIAGTESGATWGLDRVDQSALPLNGSYTYPNDGTGVHAYIMDTGIEFGHVDFGSRAVAGVDEISPSGGAADCNGHGTHVAGTLGGATYGIAKNVTLVSVRVLDCSGAGTLAEALSGLNWVDSNAVKPAVVNMSLETGFSSALNLAVANTVTDSLVVVVAAGNDTSAACNVSPASESTAITVAASNSSDQFPVFSNSGSCVDLIAPGVSITSDWYTSTTATALDTGTSMSTPHVAGAAAMYLVAHPTATPAQVAAALVANATSGAISSVPAGTPNLLLYTGFIPAVTFGSWSVSGTVSSTNPVVTWTVPTVSNADTSNTRFAVYRTTSVSGQLVDSNDLIASNYQGTQYLDLARTVASYSGTTNPGPRFDWVSYYVVVSNSGGTSQHGPVYFKCGPYGGGC